MEERKKKKEEKRGRQYLFKFLKEIITQLVIYVRMAEWSKAPDSRLKLYPVIQDDWDFWSSYEGVGSNPTSDKPFYSQLFVFVVVQLDKVHCT